MPRDAPVTSAVRPSSENSFIAAKRKRRHGARRPCHTDAVKRFWHIPRFSLRSVDVAQRLDTFLVCAIGAVLGNRFFLILTGYPQLGNGTLHISHAIWGALMMAIAIIFAISYLPPFTRTFVAFLGGAGFGWFIDELGKFITRDVNYFFEPTIALIYIVFVVMYLAFRSVELRAFRPDEAVLNAIEALKSASLGRLDDHQRREAIALLDSTGANDVLATRRAEPPRRHSARCRRTTPAGSRRTAARLRARYLQFTEYPVVRRSSSTRCSCSLAAAQGGERVALRARRHRHPRLRRVVRRSSRRWSPASLIVVGAIRLPRSRVDCAAVVRPWTARRDPRDAGLHLPAAPAPAACVGLVWTIVGRGSSSAPRCGRSGSARAWPKPQSWMPRRRNRFRRLTRYGVAREAGPGGARGEVVGAMGGRRHLPVRPVEEPCRDLRHRHAAAHGERVAPHGIGVRLRPDRRHRPLPAHARARGLLPDGLGRQRAAHRAPGAELLRRALRPVAALRPQLRAPARAPEAAGADLAAELRRALPSPHRRGRARLRRPVAPRRAVGRLDDDLRHDRRGCAAGLTARVPAEPRPG